MASPSLSQRAPLLWLLLPFVAGLAASHAWEVPPRGLAVLAATALALCAVAVLAAWRGERWRRFVWPGALVAAVALAGFVYLQARSPHRLRWDDLPPREVTVTVEAEQVFPHAAAARNVTGVGRIVAAEPHLTELTGQRVYFSAIRKVNATAPVRSGRYLIRGVLEPLPADPAEASFNDYLVNLGAHLKLARAQIVREERPPAAFLAWCQRTSVRCEVILGWGLERHRDVASVYVGMLLGTKAALTTGQQNAFMRSGTFHIFSVSGLHVGVIALAIQGVLLLARLPRAVAVTAGLAVLWLYVEITGASAPAVRSFVMIAFLLSSRVLRLPGNALAALAAAALLTLVLDPRQLFSSGFQMSYAVVVALVVMGVPLAERWQAVWRPWASLPEADWRWWQRWIATSGRWLGCALAAGWAALLASTPSGIGYFHLFSPGGLLANLVILPVSSLALIAGFLSLVAGSVGAVPVSLLFNRAAALLVVVMDELVQHGTELPGVYFPARFVAPGLAPALLALVTGLMLAGLAVRWAPRRGGYWPPAVAVAAALILLVKFD